jgi:rod shape determining protein RodA
MLLIVLEKETGSALVYVGFLLVFYREGMSGLVLILGILTIIIFIITLVISPYVSISVLLALIIITLGILSKKKFFYALIFVAVMTALYYFPRLLEMPNIASKNPFSAEIWITIFSVPIAIFFLIRSIIKKITYFRNTLLCFLCGVGLIFSVEFLFENILKDYQRARIENLLGIKDDLQGVGYNVHQSKIAIGSGGLLGKGYLNGTQTRFNFVPEQSTDFIFCTIGEEWGFIGSVAILMLYMFILIRILKLAEKSKDDFVRIYGYCVVSCILMHIIINVCMTIGLMPVIGIPLPFLSYGGSSLWAFTILLFIFIRLDLERWR